MRTRRRKNASLLSSSNNMHQTKSVHKKKREERVVPNKSKEKYGAGVRRGGGEKEVALEMERLVRWDEGAELEAKNTGERKRVV